MSFLTPRGECADQIDVDEIPEFVDRYGVRGIPTPVLIKNGEVQETVIGVVPKSQLTDVIDRHAV